MTVEIKMPQAAMAMTEGTLTEWLVEDGALVAQGQPLYAFESEKVEMVVDSPANGRLQVVAKVGETVAVGTSVGTIEPTV